MFVKGKISVIIPLYNTEEFIAPCLESILGQTYQNFEVIIIDDGSTDRSVDMVLNYKRADNRITLIRQENKGPSAARNIGIELSNGEYLYFLDSDDYIDQNTFETCINIFENTGVDLVTFDAQSVFEKKYLKSIENKVYEYLGEFYDRTDCFPHKTPMNFSDFFMLSHLSNKIRVNTWLFIVKSEVIKNNQVRFNENISYFEDALFLYYISNYINKLIYNSNKFYYRRLTGSSLMTKKINKKRIEDPISCINEIAKDLNTENNIIKKIMERRFVFFLNESWEKSDQEVRDSVNLDKPSKLFLESLSTFEKIKNELELKYINELIKLEKSLMN